MGYDYVVAYFEVVVGVEHAVILYVGVTSHPDAAIIAAQDGSGPDAGVCADVNVSNDVSRLADEGCGVNGGFDAVKASNHCIVGLR